MKNKLIIVVLRQPRTSDKNESRSDPFWEFGSFGTTGCHSYNLMNKRNEDHVNGSQFAFVQGGQDGVKLVLITPNIIANTKREFMEAVWGPPKMPLIYSKAPLIINKDGKSDFILLRNEILKHKKQSNIQKFTSAFRSRVGEVDQEISEEMLNVFNKFYKDKNNIAKHYEEALPYIPNCVDNNRFKTYKELKSKSVKLNCGKEQKSKMKSEAKRISKC